MAKTNEHIDVCYSDELFIFLLIIVFVIYVCRIPTMGQIRQFVLNIEWTPQLAAQTQVFYNVSSRLVFVGGSGSSSERITLPNLPVYQDLPPETCSKNKTTELFFFLNK